MNRFFDFLWPTAKYTAQDAADDKADLTRDLAVIGSVQWGGSDELLLGEARRLY